ncbi:hypothetical protein ACFL1X_09295 [Candidatus Hydrogenedentota bacterium]
MKEAATMPRVRDRFWLWAHEAGTQNDRWGISGHSRISPVEACHYIGIPNVIMVRNPVRPIPADPQFAVPFRSLHQMVWAITGPEGLHSDAETASAFIQAERLPIMTPVMMDDFFLKRSPSAIVCA